MHIPHLLALLLTPSLAAPAAPPSAAVAIEGQVDFNRLADKYFAEHKPAAKAIAELTFDDVIESDFVPASMGALELRLPRESLKEKSAVEDFKACLVATLQVHQLWLDWLGSKGAEAEQAKRDIAEILKFLKTARIAPGGEREATFFAALGGSQAIVAVVERLNTGFRNGKSMGIEPRSSRPQIVLVAPTRQLFMELAGVLGRMQEGARSLYWNDALIHWTEFAWNEWQVMATQYPPQRPKTDDFKEGSPMNDRDPTGLAENAAQRAAVTLCWHSFGKALDPAFELALAQTIVVDLYGQNTTRSGGSGRANEVNGMEAFIPGGNSSGGALPPGNADSVWRSDAGKDYFERVLRDGLKAGAKGAKAKDDKHAYFALASDNTGKKFFVRAPFLGSAAQGKELPPQEFLSDYLEFFRAYRSCFVHWLRVKSTKPAEGERLFGELMRRIAEAGGAASFEELVAEVYATPYSTQDLTQTSLEQRFLAWLAGK